MRRPRPVPVTRRMLPADSEADAARVPGPGRAKGRRPECFANSSSPSSPRWLRSWKRQRTPSPRRCPVPPRTVPGCGWSRPGGYVFGCSSCHRPRAGPGPRRQVSDSSATGAGACDQEPRAEADASAANTTPSSAGRARNRRTHPRAVVSGTPIRAAAGRTPHHQLSGRRAASLGRDKLRRFP